MSDNIKAHDLRIDPTDLPENEKHVLARTNFGSVFVAVHVTTPEGASHWFYTYGEDVVAWCELPECMQTGAGYDDPIDIFAEDDPNAGIFTE